MNIITAPESLTNFTKPTVFLAGSIEMGVADDWQRKTITQLNVLEHNFTVLNPRRADWDSTWEQKIGNPKFKEQVDWEIKALQHVATLAAFYFDADTKSPITLWELGLVCGMGIPSIVYCPEPYFRKGNVDIYCQEFDIKQVTTFDEYVYEIKKHIIDYQTK